MVLFMHQVSVGLSYLFVHGCDIRASYTFSWYLLGISHVWYVNSSGPWESGDLKWCFEVLQSKCVCCFMCLKGGKFLSQMKTCWITTGFLPRPSCISGWLDLIFLLNSSSNTKDISFFWFLQVCNSLIKTNIHFVSNQNTDQPKAVGHLSMIIALQPEIPDTHATNRENNVSQRKHQSQRYIDQ